MVGDNLTLSRGLMPSWDPFQLYFPLILFCDFVVLLERFPLFLLTSQNTTPM